MNVVGTLGCVHSDRQSGPTLGELGETTDDDYYSWLRRPGFGATWPFQLSGTLHGFFFRGLETVACLGMMELTYAGISLSRIFFWAVKDSRRVRLDAQLVPSRPTLAPCVQVP